MAELFHLAANAPWLAYSAYLAGAAYFTLPHIIEVAHEHHARTSGLKDFLAETASSASSTITSAVLSTTFNPLITTVTSTAWYISTYTRTITDLTAFRHTITETVTETLTDPVPRTVASLSRDVLQASSSGESGRIAEVYNASTAFQSTSESLLQQAKNFASNTTSTVSGKIEPAFMGIRTLSTTIWEYLLLIIYSRYFRYMILAYVVFAIAYLVIRALSPYIPTFAILRALFEAAWAKIRSACRFVSNIIREKAFSLYYASLAAVGLATDYVIGGFDLFKRGIKLSQHLLSAATTQFAQNVVLAGQNTKNGIVRLGQICSPTLVVAAQSVLQGAQAAMNGLKSLQRFITLRHLVIPTILLLPWIFWYSNGLQKLRSVHWGVDPHRLVHQPANLTKPSFVSANQTCPNKESNSNLTSSSVCAANNSIGLQDGGSNFHYSLQSILASVWSYLASFYPSFTQEKFNVNNSVPQPIPVTMPSAFASDQSSSVQEATSSLMTTPDIAVEQSSSIQEAISTCATPSIFAASQSCSQIEDDIGSFRNSSHSTLSLVKSYVSNLYPSSKRRETDSRKSIYQPCNPTKPFVFAANHSYSWPRRSISILHYPIQSISTLVGSYLFSFYTLPKSRDNSLFSVLSTIILAVLTADSVRTAVHFFKAPSTHKRTTPILILFFILTTILLGLKDVRSQQDLIVALSAFCVSVILDPVELIWQAPRKQVILSRFLEALRNMHIMPPKFMKMPWNKIIRPCLRAILEWYNDLYQGTRDTFMWISMLFLLIEFSYSRNVDRTVWLLLTTLQYYFRPNNPRHELRATSQDAATQKDPEPEQRNPIKADQDGASQASHEDEQSRSSEDNNSGEAEEDDSTDTHSWPRPDRRNRPLPENAQTSDLGFDPSMVPPHLLREFNNLNRTAQLIRRLRGTIQEGNNKNDEGEHVNPFQDQIDAARREIDEINRMALEHQDEDTSSEEESTEDSGSRPASEHPQTSAPDLGSSVSRFDYRRQLDSQEHIIQLLRDERDGHRQRPSVPQYERSGSYSRLLDAARRQRDSQNQMLREEQSFRPRAFETLPGREIKHEDTGAEDESKIYSGSKTVPEEPQTSAPDLDLSRVHPDQITELSHLDRLIQLTGEKLESHQSRLEDNESAKDSPYRRLLDSSRLKRDSLIQRLREEQNAGPSSSESEARPKSEHGDAATMEGEQISEDNGQENSGARNGNPESST